MRKIKLFEDFTNEDIKKFEDFGKESTEDQPTEGHHGEEEEEEDDNYEVSADDEKEMEEGEVDDEDDHLEEKADPLTVTSKDIMRIQDIMRKSEGNMYKAKKLAETMCKLITDKWKALRRARAAEREGQPDLADIFTHRAKELGAMGA